MLSLYLNNQKQDYKSFVFNGGEVQVKLPLLPLQWDGNHGPVRYEAKIMAHIRTSDDVMEMLMLTDALRRHLGINLEWLEVCMPYLPYARQDRVCDSGEALALKVFADLINSQKYDQVTVWDAHSDVALALIDNIKVVKQGELLTNLTKSGWFKSDKTVLVSPDSGANKKILEVAQWLRLKDVVRADKTRDTTTGAITGTTVYSEHIGDRDFLIVDDICDGGRTFVELAKVLRPLTNGSIFLYVTHGIFSAGFDALKENIEQIFTPNCFVEDPDKSFVTIIHH